MKAKWLVAVALVSLVALAGFDLALAQTKWKVVVTTRPLPQFQLWVWLGEELGNIADTPMAELVGSERQRAFGAAKRDTLPRYCRECPVRFA
jgi:hypothetical protein